MFLSSASRHQVINGGITRARYGVVSKVVNRVVPSILTGYAIYSSAFSFLPGIHGCVWTRVIENHIQIDPPPMTNIVDQTLTGN